MAFQLENTVLNDVLCYISSARDALSHEKIILNALAFYDTEAVKQAKEVIFGILKEKPIKRKTCSSHPNPTVADLEDILQMFDKAESNVNLPRFVAAGFLSMPPSSAFESLASVMCSLRDEVSALRLEVTEIRKANERDFKALDNVGCIIQDVAEIKLLLHSSPGNNEKNQSAGLECVLDGVISQDTDVSFNQLSHENFEVQSTLNVPSTLKNNPPIRKSYSEALQLERKSSLVTQRVFERGGGASTNPRRVRPVTRRKLNISGTKKNSNGLSSGLRILDLFVGGCGLNTTEGDLTKYCSENNITVKKCEMLDSRSEWTKSFKISVDASIRDKLLEAEFWPTGIFVRKFFRPKEVRN